MKKEVSIRKATIKDLKTVYEMQLKFAKHCIKNYNLGIFLNPEYLKKPYYEYIKKSLKSRKAFYLLLEKNGKQIGYSELRFTKPRPYSKYKKCAEITDLYILPGNRKKGYGKLLLDSSIDFLKQKGCELVSLGVNLDNPSVKLYLRCGFKTDYLAMYKKLK